MQQLLWFPGTVSNPLAVGMVRKPITTWQAFTLHSPQQLSCFFLVLPSKTQHAGLDLGFFFFR